MAAVADAFVRGDYLSAARDLTADSWQYWASLGLLGHPADAARELRGVDTPDASFYSGVVSWIAGDTERAIHALDRCDTAHARRLKEQIRRPVRVLAQLPWNRHGCWDLASHLDDPAFDVMNVSFHPDDVQNRPYADAAALLTPGWRPDLFVAEMLEWHLIPPNIRTLGCPVIGHSSDFDIHVQAVVPWLELFDELVVLDSVEWTYMTGLSSVPVSVYSKVFGVSPDLPALVGAERPIDVFLSGTVMHPYHADKDRLVIDVLRVPAANVRILNGFDSARDYFSNLLQAKMCCTYIRHPGGLSTRGLDALGMGCVVAVQEENVLRLFADAQAGVVAYGPSSGDLAVVIDKVLTQWDEYSARARAGAEIVRREFALDRVASQYFRFLTFLATRPRTDRRGPPPEQMVQKRPVVHKGWLPSYEFGCGLLMDWAAQSGTRIERLLQAEESPRLLNDLARERLLAHYHDLPREDGEAQWLDSVMHPLERAVLRFPRVLVPRLNLARVLLHFGTAVQVRAGVALLDDTLRQPVDEWEIDPLDDVLPWDFFPSFFNYRRYFDAVTQLLPSPDEARPQFVAIILASLNHYRARYAFEVPGARGGIEWAADAVRFDPEFIDYALFYVRLLVTRGAAADLVAAANVLEGMARRSARLLELLDLARHLPEALRGEWYDVLDARAQRFWLATEMRENLPEPPMRSTIDPHARSLVRRRAPSDGRAAAKAQK